MLSVHIASTLAHSLYDNVYMTKLFITLLPESVYSLSLHHGVFGLTPL